MDHFKVAEEKHHQWWKMYNGAIAEGISQARSAITTSIKLAFMSEYVRLSCEISNGFI